ncbi:MAG TPA: DUF2809 domain-containing protein [Bacillota bacterium]|nr:DUF2809 domain-containing protein [Bacillota bacterium]HOK68177.1 DUF2809 domain-containing protein [Bacillota bacterium]HPP84975.1 DUF2809 domain-containing protein [Bacillota bacterium]
MKAFIKPRIKYLFAFLLLTAVEFAIALFVRDRFVRPYLGDVIIIFVIYCFIRTLFPSGIKLLPLYIFLFALAVETAQYFDFVALLGLDGSRFFRILLGATFSFADIACYAAGSIICFAVEYLQKRIHKRKN